MLGLLEGVTMALPLYHKSLHMTFVIYGVYIYTYIYTHLLSGTSTHSNWRCRRDQKPSGTMPIGVWLEIMNP